MLLFNNIYKKRIEFSNSVTLGYSAGVKLRKKFNDFYEFRTYVLSDHNNWWLLF